MFDHLLALTPSNFHEEALHSDKPVFIVFWTDWCGDLTQLEADVKTLEEEFKGKIKFAQVNADEESHVTKSCQVMTLPNVIVVKDKKIIKHKTGTNSIEICRKLIKEALTVKENEAPVAKTETENK